MVPRNRRVLYLGLSVVTAAGSMALAPQNVFAYAVNVRNQCQKYGSPVFLHFAPTLGSILPIGSGDVMKIQSSPSVQNSAFVSLAAGDRDQIIFFQHDSSSQKSTWRLWWDGFPSSQGARGQTLVETTCVSLNQTAQTCWVDVSLVDGFSSTVLVEFPDAATTPITVRPVQDWTCPVANRIDANGGYPPTFLSQKIACLSNCTVENTDAACCRGKYNSPVACMNANAAMKAGMPEAYAFAYDDLPSLHVSNPENQPLKAFTTGIGKEIMRITICY